MKSTPVKGTRDYLPKEVQIRDYLQNVILETYQDAGFERITTPIIEDAVNLDKSEGGENLNLIFKILKIMMWKITFIISPSTAFIMTRKTIFIICTIKIIITFY